MINKMSIYKKYTDIEIEFDIKEKDMDKER